MHRRALIASLEKYRNLHASEVDKTNRFLGFVRENNRCFSRQLLSGHVTGSAWLVDKTGDRVLLTHHKKLGMWLQLGGHADGEADVPAVALREAREESGNSHIELLTPDIFDIDIHAIPANSRDPEHFHYDVRYLLGVTQSEKVVTGSESIDLAWADVVCVEEYTREESILRMRDKWVGVKDRYF